jgi:hypothetical protein
MTIQNLVEPGYSPDVFCSNLSRIDCIGSNRRLVFTVPDVADPEYRVVVAKLIIPADYMATLIHFVAGVDENTISRQLLAFDPRCAH